MDPSPPTIPDPVAGGAIPGIGDAAPGTHVALPPPSVDGNGVLAGAVGFARALRVAGIATDPASTIDFTRALSIVDIGDRAEVHAAGSAIFVRRRDDLPVYDAVFDAFWRPRAPSAGPGPTLDAEPPAAPDASEPEQTSSASEAGAERATPTGALVSADEGGAARVDSHLIAPDAYSRGEVIRHRAFERMTSTELREAERLIDMLSLRLETRRTRRRELHHHGRTLAPRIMLRRNLATGGDLVDWVWQRPVRRPRSIVVLCDISGSMERQSRLLLRFVQALSSAPVRTEAFVFGTRLTRVTRLLRDRDRDRALGRVADAVVDWSGGTRIGDAFSEFNRRWARRVLRTSGVVIVVSDGWDRGDVAAVGTETARLARNCHRLIWLNPLAGAEGYRPLAGGMAAAYPHIDDFVAAGTVASLEQLGELLGGLRDQRHAPGELLGGRPGVPRTWRTPVAS